MPRVSVSCGVRFHIPRVYEALLRRECVTGARARLGPLGAERARRPLAERECEYEVRLAAGEPLEVLRSSIGGHTVRIPVAAPQWLRQPSIEGGARAVRVFADDTVEPVLDQPQRRL